MRIALAQINSVVGDLAGNAERVTARIEDAKRQSVDLVRNHPLLPKGIPVGGSTRRSFWQTCAGSARKCISSICCREHSMPGF